MHSQIRFVEGLSEEGAFHKIFYKEESFENIIGWRKLKENIPDSDEMFRITLMGTLTFENDLSAAVEDPVELSHFGDVVVLDSSYFKKSDVEELDIEENEQSFDDEDALSWEDYVASKKEERRLEAEAEESRIRDLELAKIKEEEERLQQEELALQEVEDTPKPRNIEEEKEFLLSELKSIKKKLKKHKRETKRLKKSSEKILQKLELLSDEDFIKTLKGES